MITLLKRTTFTHTLPCFKNTFSFSFRKRWAEKILERNQQQAKMWKQSKAQEDQQLLKKAEEQLTTDEKQVIKAYKVDKLWNLMLKQSPDHNFQKQIILHKKAFEQTTKQLRSAILFQDLLKTQIDVLIYDTKGRPYAHNLLKFFYVLITIAGSLWSINLFREHDPKNKVLMDRTTHGKIIKYSLYSMLIILFCVTLSRYSSFSRKYVQKVIYNTQKQEFTFVKRNFFGFKYDYVASRFKILYTENPFLTKKGTNYFDIDTKQQFSIPYKQSWIRQDLFSHLISQRIKL